MFKKIGIILFFAAIVGARHALPLQGLAFALLQDDGTPCPPECVTDSMEIVTWYPSPYNEYEELRLYPVQRDDSYCTDDKKGLMYYHESNNKVYVCKGVSIGWKEVGAFVAPDSASNNIYYNSGNVGIGTSSPSQKLEVSGGIKIGDSSNAVAGTIRWTGSSFEGYDGAQWISLSGNSSGADKLCDASTGTCGNVRISSKGDTYGSSQYYGGTCYWVNGDCTQDDCSDNCDGNCTDRYTCGVSAKTCTDMFGLTSVATHGSNPPSTAYLSWSKSTRVITCGGVEVKIE